MKNKTTSNFSLELQSHLSGRSLLATEIPFPEKLIKKHSELELIQSTPGIVRQTKLLRCNRCANTTQRLFANFPCATCGNEAGCHYCRNCIMMGRVSTCTPLYSWAGPNPEVPDKNDSFLSWEGELSPGQMTASKAAVNAVKENAELLVWAVCGAGKTEVLFEAINQALQKNLRVCIATPRTDVVLELAPRFKKVFPSIQVAALYGGSDDRHQYAPLTISTTHQLLRFEKAFDVMIVDEVDAFPFTFDDSLKWAVEKSTKIKATRIFLTATPSAKWQAECKYGKRPHVKIPARYHRKPLPVPTFKWCGNWQKQLEKGRIPHTVKNWTIQRIQTGKQTLLFLPHIELMEKALPLFRQLHPDIETVHSEDPLRKEKVEKMRQREIPLLLTTTILERGVTFPNIDVAVIGAEDDIFTEAALVQIAGRVGRSADFPGGNITFFHYGRTKAMIRALVHISDMNKQAKKKGLIDS
ncbi:DEAD/DEAH box helicase [Lederbergia citrea]|uniref:DEAD/DEAH box helicase n=1 Tax=Lederbergia citrea TaxID=2833581 RepID=A0A942UQQ3_9BACI|nr:DEAD/DEAH box helicase [Lederbergia citrea]MBS4223203.1 DEAD/DEAH box helicase [Lederbergia citrea]